MLPASCPEEPEALPLMPLPASRIPPLEPEEEPLDPETVPDELPLAPDEEPLVPDPPVLPLVPQAIWGIPMFTQASKVEISEALGAAVPVGGMGAVLDAMRVTHICPTVSDGLVVAGPVRFAYASRDIGAPAVGGEEWQDTQNDCNIVLTSVGMPQPEAVVPLLPVLPVPVLVPAVPVLVPVVPPTPLVAPVPVPLVPALVPVAPVDPAPVPPPLEPDSVLPEEPVTADPLSDPPYGRIVSPEEQPANGTSSPNNPNARLSFINPSLMNQVFHWEQIRRKQLETSRASPEQVFPLKGDCVHFFWVSFRAAGLVLPAP